HRGARVDGGSRVDSLRLMSLLARLGLLTLLWMTPVASAEPLKVRLEYLQDEASSRCSSQEALRGSISARLGRDPWDDAAPQRLRLSLRPRPPRAPRVFRFPRSSPRAGLPASPWAWEPAPPGACSPRRGSPFRSKASSAPSASRSLWTRRPGLRAPRPWSPS